MQDGIAKILYSEKEIRATVAAMGQKISADYAGKKLMMISVLKGSVVFMSDLMRAVTVDCRIDFMSVSSYGSGVKTSGVVKILKDLDTSITGYDVLVVEDILDSGMTLSYILELLATRGPNSIRLCTLLDKPERRKVDVSTAYCGFQVPDEFLVGYGLDYDEKYRNLPYIGILKPEVYAPVD